jgi:hypothetical protein
MQKSTRLKRACDRSTIGSRTRHGWSKWRYEV